MTIIQKLQAKKSKKGFTLVELVIVIAILAILAAIAIPVVTSLIETANINSDRSDAATIDLALKSYRTQYDSGIITDPPVTPLVSHALADNGLDTDILNGRRGAFYFDANNRVVCFDDRGTATDTVVIGDTVPEY